VTEEEMSYQNEDWRIDLQTISTRMSKTLGKQKNASMF